MAVLLSDDFNRVNSTTTLGSPQIGPAPTVAFGTMGIVGNQAYGTITAQSVAHYNLGTPNVELTITGYNNNTSTVGIVLGYVSTTDFYYVSMGISAGVTIAKTNPGGISVLVSTTANNPAINGSTLKAHYRDGIIRGYVNGILTVRHVLDAPITSNLHGIRVNYNDQRIDNLLGTDAPVIDEPIRTGGLQTADLTFNKTTNNLHSGFAYLGRDTKIQDIAPGA